MNENTETETKKEARITGKPGRLITDRQIAAIFAIRKFCKKNYFGLLDRFRELYFTDKKTIQEWENTPLEDRMKLSERHFARTGKRKMADIGLEIAPEIGEKSSFSVSERILVMAIKRGDISQEDADKERWYRSSVQITEITRRMKIEGSGIFYWPEEKRQKNRERLIKNRGLDCYTSQEDNLMLKLMQNPEYIIPPGSRNSGHIHWGKIAEEMNRIFGKNRGRDAVRVRYDRLIKAGKLEDIRASVPKSYSNEEDSYLLRLTESPGFRYERGTRYAGKLHWNRIATDINRRFGKNRKPKVLSDRYIHLKKTI